ncbi:MAG: hypothetical protein CME63_10660 [Halobacteriovoraceae bacterium]|nr:hypothetical protein [Halobacteriovoraceae bacterium]|tara:strand:+ start:99440 stop:100594 length:1155 start_codon:yes stop_codon:yes gene_type:complete
MKFLLKNILITTILLVFIEICAGLLLTPNRYNEIYGALRVDSDYMWKVTPNYEDLFFGAPLKTNKHGFRVNEGLSECEKRIGVFGASPSFGWGVENQYTYTNQLNEIYRSKGICFFNYSAIGYSSSQGRKLFSKMINKENLDAVIVSYLVNDVDFNRFFFLSDKTDQKVLDNLGLLSLSFWMERLKESHSFKLVRQLMTKEISQEIQRNQLEKSMGYVRVESAEFIENLNSMLKLAQDKKIDFYYLEMPMGLMTITKYLKDKCAIRFQERFETETDFKENIDDILLKLTQCNTEEYSEILKKNTDNKIDQIRALVAMGRFEKNRNLLRKAWAKKNVPIIKVREQNMNDLKSSFLSRNYDFVHPSSLGHQMIAEDIVKELNLGLD